MHLTRQTYYYFIIGIIILLSFSFYSSNFYPLLSSDDALNILMAHYYRLPHDIYCWGQDRGGTLIPFLSQGFIKLFGLPALTSVSLSNYLVLILGFFGFSSLFKTSYSKILFAVIWFLPFQRFIDLLRYPIGVQYSLLGIIIWLITRIDFKNNPPPLKNHILLLAIVVSSILSVWVSDPAILTIMLLFSVLYVFQFRSNRNFSMHKYILFYAIGGTIACALFVQFAKTRNGIYTDTYYAINGLNAIRSALLFLKDVFIQILTYKTKDVFATVYTYLAIVLLIVFTGYLIFTKTLKKILSNKWIAFFSLDLLMVFSVLLLSSWVLANGMGRRYFVATYISLSMVVLLAVEMLQTLQYRVSLIKWSMVTLAVLGAMSPLFHMRYIRPKTLRPMVEVVGEYRQLGEIGIIADYWESYISSCPDPETVKATPHDKAGIRSQELVDRVFAQKDLYIIKNLWMDDFPDTLEQFGYVLLKDGPPFHLGAGDLCKYKKVKVHKVFPCTVLDVDTAQVLRDHSVSRTALFASLSDSISGNKLLVRGPDIPIGIGVFTARFWLRAENAAHDHAIAKLEVTADNGATLLATRKLDMRDFKNDGYISVDVDFLTTNRCNHVEFMVYYYGNADLYFTHVELMEK